MAGLTTDQEQAIKALWVAKDILKGDARSEALKEALGVKLGANKAFLFMAIINEIPLLLKSLVEAGESVGASPSE
jgi:hypothetical protein